MNNDNENSLLDIHDIASEKTAYDVDALEKELETELSKQLAEINLLEEDRAKIHNPDYLGEEILSVVWEQFINQVGAVAGEDFIKENRGLPLNLRKDAHIQTTENFEKGIIATHNPTTDYQERYDNWQSNFRKDSDGNIMMHQTRTGKLEATLQRGARAPFDEGRPCGSKLKHTDIDHTISAGEIIRDPAANAHLSKEEQISFANSVANLNEIDSGMNRSKGDLPMTDWLDNPNAKGQKPCDIFDISDELDKQFREKDKEARKVYSELKEAGVQESIKTGKQSRKNEAFRMGKKAVRSAVTVLLAKLVRNIVGSIVKWLKTSARTLEGLFKIIKSTVHDFLKDIENNIILAGDAIGTAIMTAIWGPIVSAVKKVWMLLKTFASSVKEALQFFCNPDNKDMPFGLKLLNAGKIITAGLTAGGAIILGEVIEKGLMTIPVFAVQIPLFGSLASVLGIFFGAVIAGIVGALAIYAIDKAVAGRRKIEIIKSQITKGNEIIGTQQKLMDVSDAKKEKLKQSTTDSIRDRHNDASSLLKDAVDFIFKDNEFDNTPKFEKMDNLLADLV